MQTTIPSKTGVCLEGGVHFEKGEWDLRAPCPWAILKQKRIILTFGVQKAKLKGLPSPVCRWMVEVLPDSVEHVWESNLGELGSSL